MPEFYTPPKYLASNFHCANCGVYAPQRWLTMYTRLEGAEDIEVEGFGLSHCEHCDKLAVWHGSELVFPIINRVPPPNPDLNPFIQEDYNEAAKILTLSPKISAVLLRIVIRKICKQLGEPGNNIDNDIASLVKKGLDPKLQRAMNLLRVTGTNAVHPGEIDRRDDIDTARNLFEIINLIAHQMITYPQSINQLYRSLGESVINAFEERQSANNT
jgi:hypothetical protein